MKSANYSQRAGATKFRCATCSPLAVAPCYPDMTVMLNLISLLIGIPALFAGIVAFTPLLGWANWLVIPVAIVGAAIGALSDSNAGRNLNILVIGVGVARLMLGGGIL